MESLSPVYKIKLPKQGLIFQTLDRKKILKLTVYKEILRFHDNQEKLITEIDVSKENEALTICNDKQALVATLDISKDSALLTISAEGKEKSVFYNKQKELVVIMSRPEYSRTPVIIRNKKGKIIWPKI
jgi:hypothetical protein